MSRLVDWARRAIATPLAAVERRLLMTPARLAHAPLFVISLPRSGSTLFHLLLVQRFRLAYFSNLMAAFPASPVTVARLTRPLGGLDPPATLDSHYGTTRGWRAPNQGWRLWNRWLPEAVDWIEPRSLDAAAVAEMRATIDQLQRCVGAPFANKWQRHVPRLRALATAFPEALFLNITRSPEFVAQSILAGRRQFLGDENAWLSARPRDHARIEGRGPIEQVCLQVVLLENDIRDDLRAIGAERFYTTSYEALCSSPGSVLDAVADWYRTRTGERLETRRPVDVGLRAQSAPKVSTAEFDRIRSLLAELYATDRL